MVGIISTGVVAYLSERKTEYVNTVTTEEVTVSVDALEERVQNALTASSTEIEAFAQKAYQDAKKKMETEIELEVRTTYRKELEVEEQKLMKQVSF